MENKSKLNTSDSGFLPFDPIVLVWDVLKRWYIILLAALAVGVGAYILTDMKYEPVYKTQTTYVVTNRSSSSTVYSNLSATSNLAPVFTEMLNSTLLQKYIFQELGTNSFDGSIEAAVISETNLLTVTVTASDPRSAYLVARAIIEHHDSLTQQVVDNVALDVLQYPEVPVGPANSANAGSQMRKMMVLTALVAAVVLAYLSMIRDVVRSGKEARTKLDCSYIGEIPHEKNYKTLGGRLRRNKTDILITNPVISFRYVETMRKICHRVEQHMHGSKVLMVTSVLEDEGKSTVAANLALTMAQKNKKVLLIDCDLRKPACHQLMDHPEFEHGVRSVVLKGVAPGKALVYDKKRKLAMLLEKKGSADSGDVVASENMKALIDWARAHFDFVVLDMPPTAVVSDAETVMEYADASLLVVRQNTAYVRAINKSVASLNSGKAKLIGCVINNVRATGMFSGDGYGYGRYGRYGRYGKYGNYGYYGRYAKRPEQD